MVAIRSLIIGITFLIISNTVFAEDLSPKELLGKVAETYENMQAYISEGKINVDVTVNGNKSNIVTKFSIKLKKPNMYLISWTQEQMPGMVQSGAVWSDGKQAYLYMGVMKAYSKMKNTKMALASATGISGGAAFTIPSLFLTGFKKSVFPLSRLKNPTIEKSENIGDDACYVLSGESNASAKESFWISKNSYLIKKYSRSLEPPSGGMAMPEFTDAQLEKAVKGMGQEVTEENKKKLKAMMEQSKAMFKKTKVKGISIESHTSISLKEPDDGDFNYNVPDGTVLKESLF